jgi:hypothetical protein
MDKREVVARAAFRHRWPTAYREVEKGVRPLPSELLQEADAILEAPGNGRCLTRWRAR